ncbi:MAG: hypothetical protein ACOWWH_01270 [Eubacteriaceae bacterium]
MAFKDQLKKIFQIYIINIIIFISLIFSMKFILIESISFSIFTEDPGITWKTIFFHNIIFIIIYGIPYIGGIYYHITISFYSAILFGMYYLENGLVLSKFVHVPFELLAFAIPVAISFRLIKKNFSRWSIIYAILIFISAIIEGTFGAL